MLIIFIYAQIPIYSYTHTDMNIAGNKSQIFIHHHSFSYQGSGQVELSLK